ncbi:hypothetical protein ACGF3C_12065 [Micromonospora sp. NPDC047762]|uniref:hypothetical protein n=1 Tax=Micromonospora sp. NPDC047762 TaxID=3364255 RepID=UPI0037218DD4
MAGGLPGRLLLRGENPGRASFLELFFDPAFVFAVVAGVLLLIVLVDGMPGLRGYARQISGRDGSDQRRHGERPDA